MNAKTGGVSSGLVVVAWVAPSNYERPSHFISLTEIRNGEPLVRLSDADAIISQQAERIKELEDLIAKPQHYCPVCSTAVTVLNQQSAALKLAKEAFSAINIEAKTFMSYENARNTFSDDTDERKVYERAMVKASELTKQALAAIDALGE